MSERVPAWAESDERYPEREAEWRAAIARAERAEAGLAALWDAGYEVRAALVDRKDPGRRYFASIDALGAVLVDTAAAAEAYRASVEAPLRAEIERLTTERIGERVAAAEAEHGSSRALAAAEADAFRRVRAEALEAAADAIERGSVLSQYGAHGWLRARAADERGGR